MDMTCLPPLWKGKKSVSSINNSGNQTMFPTVQIPLERTENWFSGFYDQLKIIKNVSELSQVQQLRVSTCRNSRVGQNFLILLKLPFSPLYCEIFKTMILNQSCRIQIDRFMNTTERLHQLLKDLLPFQ